MTFISALRKKLRPKKLLQMNVVDANNQNSSIVTPDQVPGSMDAASLMGVMPNLNDCLISQNLLKLNHLYEWKIRTVALTHDLLLFSRVGEEIVCDKVILHEVRTLHLI